MAAPSNLFYLLRLGWDLGWIIALPIALLGFGGALLDKKLSTSPLFLISGILLSLIVTSVGIYKKIKQLENRK